MLNILVILVITLSTLSHRPSIDKLAPQKLFLNLKVRNFLNFMTVATIIVVVKFSVYITIPSAKKINDLAVYFHKTISWSVLA